MYFNGAVTPGLTVTLSGAVPAGGTWVLAQATASATILAQADQTNGASWYNGDDALVLTKSAGTSVVDSIGQVGVDPGTSGAPASPPRPTTPFAVRRACVGDAVTNDAFDPATEWVGFATDAFDGLGAHTSDCGGVVEPATPVINEFSASTTGTDVEYVEVLGEPGADLSGYSVLSVEGDVGSTTAPLGVVDAIIPLGTADADGRYLASLEPNTLENGTMSLLLAEGYAGAVGDDLDTTDDGILDDGPERARAVDSVAVHDGDAGTPRTATRCSPAATTEPVAPGGASRIPDGVDTDAPADWVRNDFDLAGIPGFRAPSSTAKR